MLNVGIETQTSCTKVLAFLLSRVVMVWNWLFLDIFNFFNVMLLYRSFLKVIPVFSCMKHLTVFISYYIAGKL